MNLRDRGVFFLKPILGQAPAFSNKVGGPARGSAAGGLSQKTGIEKLPDVSNIQVILSKLGL
jgi:hypothetical protein